MQSKNFGRFRAVCEPHISVSAHQRTTYVLRTPSLMIRAAPNTTLPTRHVIQHKKVTLCCNKLHRRSPSTPVTPIIVGRGRIFAYHLLHNSTREDCRRRKFAIKAFWLQVVVPESGCAPFRIIPGSRGGLLLDWEGRYGSVWCLCR